MIAPLRHAFNQSFRPEGYQRLQSELSARLDHALGFRVAETPCFLPWSLLEECSAIGAELTHRLVGDARYLEASTRAIPAQYNAAGQDAHPHFMTADFGLVRNADGALRPMLVELQAFPSIYGYQVELCESYLSAYGLSGLGYFLGGHDAASFWQTLGKVILNGHAPENVVLTEVFPEQQKTYPDFLVTARRLGVRIVDIATLIVDRTGGGPARLSYLENGRQVPIARIYNRAIADDIDARQVRLPFDYREPLAVEWAGHPNWYFHISKFSIPWLDHPAVPRAVFLDAWMRGEGRDRLSGNREEWILKPLFGFAGKGIQFAPSEAELAAIPEDQRSGYLLQQRVHFTPVIETPFGLTQAEIRILYAWPDEGSLEPLLSLTRLGRGKMMGVDHNRNQEWVGGSAAFYPKPPREGVTDDFGVG